MSPVTPKFPTSCDRSAGRWLCALAIWAVLLVVGAGAHAGDTSASPWADNLATDLSLAEIMGEGFEGPEDEIIATDSDVGPALVPARPDSRAQSRFYAHRHLGFEARAPPSLR